MCSVPDLQHSPLASPLPVQARYTCIPHRLEWFLMRCVALHESELKVFSIHVWSERYREKLLGGRWAPLF